jgi:hypothetical protein
VARNRYGWEKRAKELARKQKNEEKQKRRQGKVQPQPEAELSRPVADEVDRLAPAETVMLPGPESDP